MDEQRAREKDEERAVDEQIIRKLRATQPDGPDNSSFWESFAQKAGDVPLTDANREEALKLVTVAIAIARGDLTLASYLRDLRIAAGLSRTDVGREVRLSSDLIGEIEGGRGQVAAIEPSRLAKWAVTVGALRQAFIELVRNTMAGQGTSKTFSPRLTRLDTSASQLESERAVRRTGLTRPIDAEDFVSKISDALDAEYSRRRRS